MAVSPPSWRPANWASRAGKSVAFGGDTSRRDSKVLRSRHIGRTAANRLDTELRERVLATVRALYPDFGPTLANEKLHAEHGLELSTESLRQLMIAGGLWRNRTRIRNVRQARSDRRAAAEVA
jgi:hypothetical protein